MTLTEYLTTSYRPDREYLDGELLERNAGEWDHSRLQVLLSCYLSNRENQWGILVALASRVRVRVTRFRVPDISVLGGPPPAGPIIVEPPFLCIEILSPSDRMQEMQDRIDDYLSFGVRYVVAAAPAHAAGVRLHAGRRSRSERRYASHGRSGHLRTFGRT